MFTINGNSDSIGQGISLDTPLAMRWVLLAAVAAVPLVCFPGLGTPFSTPKIVLLAFCAALGAVSLLTAGINPLVNVPNILVLPLLGWIGIVSLSAAFGNYVSLESFLVALLPAFLALLFIGFRPSPRQALRNMVIAGVLVALMALFQYFGTDPFGLFGWQSPSFSSRRMLVYATLGNPNFVAAFLSGLLPVALVFQWNRPIKARWRAWTRLAVILILAGGILATGSRAPVLAAAAVVVWLLFALTGRRRLAVALLVAVSVLIVSFSPARPLPDTIRGRLYIWRVVMPHALEHPWIGSGPGSFLLDYPAWETAAASGLEADHPDRRFIAVQQHAHNDYLEFLLDYGMIGLICILSLPAILLGRLVLERRRKGKVDPLTEGAAAGLVAIMAIALVDFPLQRPAEMFMFWIYMAIIIVSISQFPAAAAATNVAFAGADRPNPTGGDRC